MGKQEPTQKEVFEALIEAIQYGMKRAEERDKKKLRNHGKESDIDR